MRGFGPWATAITSAPLSGFWRRRLGRLPLLARSAPSGHSRRWGALPAVGLLALPLVLPTAPAAGPPAPEPPKSPPAPKATADKWLAPAGLAKPYALADGEVLKCFQPPFPPERAEWAHANYPTVPPEWVAGVVWRWKGPRLEYYAFRSSRDGKVPATDMVRGAIQVPLSAFEGPGLAWLDAKVTADVVFRDGTPPDKLATALGDALRRDFRIPVRLTYREEEREVIVARGTFPNLPVPGSRDKPILIYGKQPPGPGRNEGRTLQGPWSWFLDRLSLYTGTRVVSDNPAARQGMVYFRLPADLTRTCRHEGAAPFEVLAKVTEQTGLIFGTERRRVPVLVVEKVD